MKIVVAPDSFKESLTADEAARAIEAGFRAVLPDAEIIRVPMADGGEGTIAAVVAAIGGTIIPVTVTSPVGEPVLASYWLSPDGQTAIVEMAAASGLELVPISMRNPLKVTSYGTGELIRAVLEANVSHCVIGIGGSATVDGGAGMLQALGALLLDSDGLPISERDGAALARLSRIDLSQLDTRLQLCGFEVACDVDNPLLGATGAAIVFGPQKGATPQIVVELERNLTNFADAILAATGVNLASLSGAGAAGGLGGALVACLGAKMSFGVSLIAEVVGLEDALRDADLVITGEGRIDGQSVRGKTPVGVAKIAKRHNKPVIALVGSLGVDAQAVYAHGIDAVFSILPRICTREEAYDQAALNLRTAARDVAAVWKAGIETPRRSRHAS